MRRGTIIATVGVVVVVAAVVGLQGAQRGATQSANVAADSRAGTATKKAGAIPARAAPGAKCGHAGKLADFPVGSIAAVFGGDPRYLADCPVDQAEFGNPTGIIKVGDYFYVTSNNADVISAIDPATGQVTTLAGNTRERVSWYDEQRHDIEMFAGANDLTAIGDTIYVLNMSSTRKLDIATGTMTTIRYTEKNGRNEIKQPEAIATDGKYLYVAANFENTVYKIDPATGAIMWRAGGPEGFADGEAVSARFKRPEALAIVDGVLYVADKFNSALRKVDMETGRTTTLVGGGKNFQVAQGLVDGSGWTYASGVGTPGTALLTWPAGMASDGTFLYVADSANGAIRKVNLATGATLTLAGGNGGTDIEGEQVLAGHADGSGWSNGRPGTARFRFPNRLALDGDVLWVTEEGSYTIRKVNKNTGDTTTYSGLMFKDGTGWKNENGDWTVGTARFGGLGKIGSTDGMMGMTSIGRTIYVADTMNNAIRKIDPTGMVTTLAGGAVVGGIPTGKAGFRDGTGWSYVNGVATPGTALFSAPVGITTDGKSLFVTDVYNSAIRKVDPATGAVTTLAGGNERSSARQGAHGGAGRPNSAAPGRPGTMPFKHLRGITTDGTFLYTTDSGNGMIFRTEIASGATAILSGSAGDDLPGSAGARGDFADGTGWSNGRPGTARFYYLNDITIAGDFLYVTDGLGNAIHKVNKRTGDTVTFAGGAPLYENLSPADRDTTSTNERRAEPGHQDGTGWSKMKGRWAPGTARFESPESIVTDGKYLYVADQYGRSIRKIDLKTGETVTPSSEAPGADSNGDAGAGLMFKDGALWLSDTRGMIYKVVLRGNP